MTRRDKQKAETFIDIMRSAEELFLRQGYEQTSMQQIASHTGLTKGALYHHFNSKEALCERLCREHYRILLDAVEPYLKDKALTCFERIRRVIAASRGIGMSHIAFTSEFLRFNFDEGNLILRERLYHYDRELYATVIGPLLGEARERGEFSFSSSPEILAVFIHRLDRGVNEEINRIVTLENPGRREDRIAEILKALIETLARMLRASPEGISELIGFEETMYFYGEALKKRNPPE
ncbi:MAG: TetR/AcrR family transcriptional regulator [Spirochaetaceae bacterium]|jgi:AcrR family transcriptional regulator|nr:TetR/AcrR family transcriptional regulator [Spirochaetaceae bacterium]